MTAGDNICYMCGQPKYPQVFHICPGPRNPFTTERTPMDEIQIKAKLDQLADLQAKLDAIALEKKAAIDKVLTPEIRTQIEAVDDKYDDQAGETAGKIFLLEQEISDAA